MPFINVGTSNDLILEIPTNRTQNWDARVKANLITPITTHDHTGTGKGRNINTAAIAPNAITGAKIRLDNDEYLRARNQANGADLNLIKANTNDKLATGIDFANIAMINNTYIQGRDQADGGYVNIIKINTSDKLETSVDFAALGLINNIYFHARNQADVADVNIIKVNASDKLETSVDFSVLGLTNNAYLHARNNADGGDINIIKVNTSDKLVTGADFANLAIINNTYFQGQNNAGSGLINIIKVNTSDKLTTNVDFSNLAMIGNTYMLGRNNADSGYINVWKVNASDEIELGVKTVHNGTLEYKADRVLLSKSFTIADNASAVDVTGASVVEGEGKSFTLHYSIYVDATTDLLEQGKAKFTFINGTWQHTRQYSRDDSLVTFTSPSGQLKVTAPVYAGYVVVTMIYNIVEH